VGLRELGREGELLQNGMRKAVRLILRVTTSLTI